MHWLYPLLPFACAELVIYKDGLTDGDKANVISLYHRLMKVQWPTVLAYVDTEDPDKALVASFVECINKDLNTNCSIAEAEKMVKDTEFKVQWIPDTVFQLALMKVSEDLAYNYETHPDGHQVRKLKPELNDVLFHNFVNGAQSYREYLDKCIEFDQRPILSEAYFQTIKYYQKFGNRNDWDSIVDQILADFKPVQEKEVIGLDTDGYPIKAWMSKGHARFLKAYLKVEIDAANSNHYILSRGSTGIRVWLGNESSHVLFDLPTPCYSISYGQRLLDGSYREFGTNGARSLTYLFDWEKETPKSGYILELSMKDYLMGFRDRKANSHFHFIYLPLLSSVAGMFANSEVFHPRTKLGSNNASNGYNAMKCGKLMKKDWAENYGIFYEKDLLEADFMAGITDLLSKTIKLIPKCGGDLNFTTNLESLQNMLKKMAAEIKNSIEEKKDLTVFKDKDGKKEIFSLKYPTSKPPEDATKTNSGAGTEEPKKPEERKESTNGGNKGGSNGGSNNPSSSSSTETGATQTAPAEPENGAFKMHLGDMLINLCMCLMIVIGV